MSIREVRVQRFSIISMRPFEEVVAHIELHIGRPEMAAFRNDVEASTSFSALEEVVTRAVGPSGLMEFVRFDLGEIARKQSGSTAPRSLRIVAGNPLIMRRMLEHAPDVGSYAPVTILIDERADGVHLSYDRMASLLAPYESEEALKVARELDSKVESLLSTAATGAR